MKSRKLCGIVLNAVLVSTLVCTINMNIIANKGTFSMFTSSANGFGTIKTADVGDLIKEFNIVEEYGQQFIVIDPDEFLKDDSIVYFEVTGEAAAYITHINPIALSKDKTPMNSNSMQWKNGSTSLSVSKNNQYFISNEGKFYIPIYVNVNIWQKPSVFSTKEYKGNITLRYLNGFINESKPVTLSSNYLNSRWRCGTDYYFWEDAKKTLSNRNTGYAKSGSTLAVNEFQDDFNNKFQNEFKKSFNGTLDDEQIVVMDSIANGYREYVSGLETKNKELLKQLEELQKEKENLTNQIDDLKKKNVELSEELQGQIDALRTENQQLESTIDALRETINNNTVETIKPPVVNEIVPGGGTGTGNEAAVPGVGTGTGNEATATEGGTVTGNGATAPEVGTGKGNEEIVPEVINGTGN